MDENYPFGFNYKFQIAKQLAHIFIIGHLCFVFEMSATSFAHISIGFCVLFWFSFLNGTNSLLVKCVAYNLWSLWGFYPDTFLLFIFM